MTKEEKKARRLARAKATWFGRLMCRLLGDECGQTLMEYVVLGVMVVAAAVALVLLFGQQIRVQFTKMIDALRGQPGQAAGVANVSGEEGAASTGATIAGPEAQ